MSDENKYGTEPIFHDAGDGPVKGQGTGFGIASMILGIVSILLSCTYFNIVTGIISVILGVIQIVKNEKKGMAIAGIVCSVVSVIILLLLILLGSYMLSSGMYNEIMNSVY